ncbi:MAG: PEP-CTERM sorting domain-containing protein [Kiritimatiellae bacterium]|nr:PEP-CTERM sorting domain-containing protein [Kiritimatiellia bacterium]
MRKLMLVVAVLCGLALGASGEGISWFMNVGYANYGDGTTLLGGDVSSSIGCFVQLLWVGANGVADQAYASGDGTGSTDDVVIEWRWIGAGAAGGDDGWFSGGLTAAGGDVQSNRVYFARFWSDASPNYAAGSVPTSVTNRYANGPTWTYPHSDPVADDFDVTYGGDVDTTLTPLAIPEPGVLALVALGLIGLRLTRKQR